MHFEYLGTRNPDSWVTLPSGLHQAVDDIEIRLKGDDGYNYTVTLYPGLLTDGGSVPWMLRWFVPSWSETNHELNISFVLHDVLYATEYLPKEVADDLLEDMLMTAGISRLRASTVCWAVTNFADKHYGRNFDENEMGLFSRIIKYKLN